MAICLECGTEYPDDTTHVCPIDQPTSENSQQSYAQSQINAKVDVAVQKTTILLGSCFEFFKKFIKQPVTTMNQHSIKISEAAFFAALQPIMLFILIAVIGDRVKSTFWIISAYIGYVFNEIGFSLFIKTIIFCAVGLFILLLIKVIFGKVIFKGVLDAKKLFTLTVVSQIPFTITLVASIILMFISVKAVLLALVLGFVSCIVIGTFVFVAVFKIALDKCVYCSIFTYSIQAAVLYALLQSII
ncbi:hypothetical protein AGMMS49975_06220 [Clostridia bacterium]|nr:hypothetical protein AGMMS49975_06220 [Clostridia bacterium]